MFDVQICLRQHETKTKISTKPQSKSDLHFCSSQSSSNLTSIMQEISYYFTKLESAVLHKLLTSSIIFFILNLFLLNSKCLIEVVGQRYCENKLYSPLQIMQSLVLKSFLIEETQLILLFHFTLYQLLRLTSQKGGVRSGQYPKRPQTSYPIPSQQGRKDIKNRLQARMTLDTSSSCTCHPHKTRATIHSGSLAIEELLPGWPRYFQKQITLEKGQEECLNISRHRSR